MARQPINHGTVAGDGTGESLFNAFQKVNANETELYAAKTEVVANEAALPVTGEATKIYVAYDTGVTYKWTGTAHRAITLAPVYDASGNVTGIAGAGGTKYSLLGPQVFTVGAGGYFANLTDALGHINTLAATNLETLHTGTYTYADGLKVITAGQTISAAVNGKQLFLKHAADAFLYPIEVQALSAATKMVPWLPLYGRAAASTDFSIVSPQTNYVIVLLPGRHEVLNSLTIPAFVTIMGYGKYTSIVEGDPSVAQACLLNIPGSSTFVELAGFGMLVDSADQAGTVGLTDTGASVYTDGRRIKLRDMHHEATGAAQDCIWQKASAKNVLDDIELSNVSGKGWYDTFAILHARNVKMDKCRTIATTGGGGGGPPQGFNLAQNELVDSMFEITNSNFTSYQTYTSYSSVSIGGNISAQVATTKKCHVRLSGNVFKQSGELLVGTPVVGLETKTYGVSSNTTVASGGIVINSSNNLFQSSGADLNYGFNAGDKCTVKSMNDRTYDGAALTNVTSGTGAITAVL